MFETFFNKYNVYFDLCQGMYGKKLGRREECDSNGFWEGITTHATRK